MSNICVECGADAMADARAIERFDLHMAALFRDLLSVTEPLRVRDGVDVAHLERVRTSFQEAETALDRRLAVALQQQLTLVAPAPPAPFPPTPLPPVAATPLKPDIAPASGAGRKS
jgi:hypothetical protein